LAVSGVRVERIIVMLGKSRPGEPTRARCSVCETAKGD
jgi:hypothetical protein